MSISTAGSACLAIALAAAVFSCLSFAGGRTRYAAPALRFVTISLAASTTLLVLSLVARDFSITYVAGYTSNSTPRLFAFSALWAGMEGSLLLWTLMTSTYTAVALRKLRSGAHASIAFAILGAVQIFFIGLLLVKANPFATIAPAPSDGAGLNPLLQSPFMISHPILLYLGLTGFVVPFAFAAAWLIKGRADDEWYSIVRRSTVVSWSFLTTGIVLGAAWAYLELGWGGYWAWDPVENASLMPWLTATAFLHSMIIQERRSMLKVWNFGLILATYSLAIFGTFLTRSGLLTSVHTFSESPVGKAFLPFLAVLLLTAFALLAWRFNKLTSERRLESLLSREAMFLFNNLFFTALAFSVLWGTIYPIIAEAANGVRVSVGPPFFNSIAIPLGLALLGLAGIGPLVTWRRDSAAALRARIWFPFVVGAAASVAVVAGGVRSAGAILALGLCTFVACATLLEFAKATRARRRRSELRLVRALTETIGANRRRYGGYIVHLGVVLIFVGLAGSAFRVSYAGEVKPGEDVRVGRFDISYGSSRVYKTPEKMVNMAIFDIGVRGKNISTLTPQRNFHLAQRQPQSEIGLRTSLIDDLYLVITHMNADRSVGLRAFVNPLVAWIWIGGAVMAVGTAIVVSGSGLPRPARKTEVRAEKLESVTV